MYYLEIFDVLNRMKVRYLVVGGVAVVLHGVVRLTADLDLIVDLKQKNVLKFAEALGALGYKPKIPVNPADFADAKIRRRWIKEKNMRVFSFIHPDEMYRLIDVFLDDPLGFDAAYKRRQIITSGDTKISVISFRDLIKLKKDAARPQDLDDIAMLERLGKEYARQKKTK